MAIAEADLKIGDRVVYPNQGVCRVVATTEMEIGGHREIFIKLTREEDDATVMVPKARIDKVGLRRIADQAELNDVMSFLAAPIEGPELDWKIRHRTHGERMSEGGLISLAQVVKGLATLADIRALPPKERDLYDNARHLLVREVAASADIDETSAEDAIDMALSPPGVERKKIDLSSLALTDDDDDLGLADEEGFDHADQEETEETVPEEAEEETESETTAASEDEERGELDEAPPKPAAKKTKAKSPAKTPKKKAQPKEPKATKAAAKPAPKATKAKPPKVAKPKAKPAAKKK